MKETMLVRKDETILVREQELILVRMGKTRLVLLRKHRWAVHELRIRVISLRTISRGRLRNLRCRILFLKNFSLGTGRIRCRLLLLQSLLYLR